MKKVRTKRATRRFPVVPFLFELVTYGLLLTGYFLLVLHFLGGALQTLYSTSRTTYAVVALALIVGQGMLLEALTTVLLRFFQRWTDRG